MNENSEEWRDAAACIGVPSASAIFFPDDGKLTPQANLICQKCDVRLVCRDYALINNVEFGTWGGLGELDRRKMRSRHKKLRLNVSEQLDLIALADALEMELTA